MHILHQNDVYHAARIQAEAQAVETKQAVGFPSPSGFVLHEMAENAAETDWRTFRKPLETWFAHGGGIYFDGQTHHLVSGNEAREALTPGDVILLTHVTPYQEYLDFYKATFMAVYKYIVGWTDEPLRATLNEISRTGRG